MTILDKSLSDVCDALGRGDMTVKDLSKEFITGSRRKEGASVFCAFVEKLSSADGHREVQRIEGLIADMLRQGMSPFVVSCEGRRPYDLLPEDCGDLKESFERFRPSQEELKADIKKLFKDIKNGQPRIESFIRLYDSGIDLSSCVYPGSETSLMEAVEGIKSAEKFVFLNWLKHYPDRFSQEIDEELQKQLERQLSFNNTGSAVRDSLMKGAKANFLRNNNETYFDFTLKTSAFINSIYLLLFGAHFGHNKLKPDWPEKLQTIWNWRKTLCLDLTNELVAAAYLGNLDVVKDYFDKKPSYLTIFLKKNRNSLEILARDCGWPGIRDFIRHQLGFKDSLSSQSDNNVYPYPEDGKQDNFGENARIEGFDSPHSVEEGNASGNVGASENSSRAETKNAVSFKSDGNYPDPPPDDGPEGFGSGELGGGIGDDGRREFIYTCKFKELTEFYKCGRIPAELHDCLKKARAEIAAWELNPGVKEDFEHFFFARSAEELGTYFDTTDRIEAFNKRRPLLLCLKRYCINRLCEGMP